MTLLKFIDQEEIKEQHQKLWFNNIDKNKLKIRNKI
jgi:hypothetical protein